MTYCLYQIRNTVSGSIYVGKTGNRSERFCRHRNHLRKEVHANFLLQRAWNKYGPEAFVFEVLQEYSTDEEVTRAEKNTITHLRSTNTRLYNLVGPQFMSEESRKRISDYNKTMGIKPGPKAIERMRIANTGKRHTEDWKRRQSIAMKTKMLGRVFTPETLAKMKESQQRRRQRETENSLNSPIIVYTE